MKGDVCIGRGSRQLLSVETVRRETRTPLRSDSTLAHTTRISTWNCHWDVLIEEYRRQYPRAYDRDQSSSSPPSSDVLNYLASLKMRPPRTRVYLEQAPDGQARRSDASWIRVRESTGLRRAISGIAGPPGTEDEALPIFRGLVLDGWMFYGVREGPRYGRSTDEPGAW